MYYLSVGTIFKNESHILKEWLEHHIYHGVEHFYLINDQSTDNFLQILQPYIDKEIVTLFNPKEPKYLGRQRNLYNRHILPHFKETKWLAMIDMDEFLWSVRNIDLKKVLKTLEYFSQIQFKDNLFGSNNLIEQPISVVEGFTKRADYDKPYYKITKYIVNSDYEFSSLNVHYATHKDPNYDKNKFRFLDWQGDRKNPFLSLNHYCCQSFEFWVNVKVARGCVDNYKIKDKDEFKIYDTNDVEDLRLYEQNKSLFPALH